ncbi:MAG: PAS domain S-box protein [Deltaproteobacteria bacterium]|nr:PAS domain S-box protein [Deltaproteobacteria bacterium]
MNAFHETSFYYEGHVRDITGQKRTEQSLKDSEEKYRVLVNNIPDIVFSLDSDGNLRMVNEESLKRYGYTEREVMGFPFLQFVYEEDKERVLNHHLKVQRRQEKYSKGLRFRIFTKWGEARWVESHSHFQFDQGGRFLRAEGILRDIDDRIRAEREQERLEAQLAQGRKMEAMGVLADEIAHNFNNILSGILGLAEIVIARFLPPNSPARGYLEDILDAGGSAKELIAQIRCLAVSGTENWNVCRLHKLLEEVMPLVEAILPKGAGLKKEIHWKTADILANAAQIRQMFVNLLTNAVQALGHSPGEIVVSLNRVEFPQHLLPHPDLEEGIFAQLVISDTGQGIPAETMSRIFDPYFTTRKETGGTGLGLSVAYGIVKRHRGAVTVESEVGKGSVFTVYLPVISGRSAGRHSKGSNQNRERKNHVDC